MGERADGYILQPGGGPLIRSDIVDVYIFRRAAERPEDLGGVGRLEAPPPVERAGVEFLQLLRAGEPLGGTWQPVMAHVEHGETATQCAIREMREEVGLEESGVLGLWALEQVYPYFVAAIDAIVLSPRFAAEAPRGWEPRLNSEHTAARWVHERDVAATFMWPGQVACCREIVEFIVPEGSLARERLRIR
jgi:ADP-ribose pyrophosphatase YjhB (NUDIX family)